MSADLGTVMKQGGRVNGFLFNTEARLIRTNVFMGVFHVLSFGDNEVFEPPVVVHAAGKWKTAADAHRAALDYARIMADDGALREAVDLRQLALR